MKGRPNSDPPDDWVNGSWTVDCICGVNFDDGEEMVNCDLCGVWVHTRCSRFVRGHKSFACDKCKSLNPPPPPPPPPPLPTPPPCTATTTFTTYSKLNDSEETEVAQLLVELPTKTIKLNNPSLPLNNPHPYRLWTDRPIQHRVHSQGIPGGDPSLFHALSSVFTSHLWKSTGYIPKKFNFSFREFPCWDHDHHDHPPPPNDADNGAGVLYSLSKETSLLNIRNQLKPPPSHNKSPKDNTDKPVLHCAKRTREHLLPSKDRNGKKKTKLIPTEHDGKREKLHASKKDVIRAIQGQVHDGKALIDNHGSEKDVGLQPAVTNALIGSSKTDNSKTVPATDEGNVVPPSSSGVSELGCSADERVKAEKLSQDVPERVHKSAKTQVVALPSLEDDATENSFMKREGLILNDVIINQGALPGPSVFNTLKLRPSVEDLADASLEMKDIKTQKNLETNILAKPPYCRSKIKSDANLDNLKAVLRRRVSDVANLDGMKDLNEKTFPINHGLGNFPENVTAVPSFQACEDEGDKGMEVSGCQYERIGETTGNPCNSKLEYESSESLIEIPKIQTESNEIPCIVGDVSTKIESISQSPSITLAGKSSSNSSTMIISRSSVSDKNRSGHPQNPTSTCKRMIPNSSLSTTKESEFVDPIKDDDRRGKTKYAVKDNQKSSLNPMMKASQPSQASSSPVFKQSTLVGRDSSRHPSSKSASVESCLAPSGIGESAASSQTRHSLSVQSKNVIAAGPHRGEKVSHSNLQSSKFAQSSLGNLPASSNSPAGLSDEELALLLHQELNSSPRVPRVPRVRHAGSLPQLSSVSASNMLIKRTSSSGGKDQQMVSRRKSKDAHKDGSRSSREQSNETRKVDRVPSSPDSGKISDAVTQVEANCELLHSAENNVESVSPSAANSGPSSHSASEQNPSSSQGLLVNNREDDTGANKGVTPSHRTLPGLIAEIMSKGKRMTYEELCNAVLPHWQSLRKHNGERYAYSSHSQAVLDCLRNRSEWARLVDRGPKTNASRKKRKMDGEGCNMESEDGEERKMKDGERKNKEEFPKGRRNARRRRKVGVQGRYMKDDRRKRRKIGIGAVSDESSSSSDAREGSGCSEDESQESGMYTGKSEEVSGSTDG